MRSLAIHAKQHTHVEDKAMDKVTQTLVRQKVLEILQPAKWRIPDDFMTYPHYERVVRQLNWTSSPGFPYLRHYANNGQFFKVKDGEPDEYRMVQVWNQVLHQLNNRRCDPIRLFVKPEPISKRKLENDKFRLISSVSIIDQIIDHMIFGELNQNLIEKCHETPIKTGWTPLLGGWKEVPRVKIVSTDKSSFDWTVVRWLIEEEIQIRMGLCENMTQYWKNLAQWRYECLFIKPLYVTSGGLFLRQKFDGVMKSGCVNTISSNSIMQLILHYRAALELSLPPPFMWAMGDDVIQENYPQEYFDLLDRYSIIKEKTSHVEFAGYRFNGYNVEPLYFGKHAFMLMHQKLEYLEETANAYALLYHRSARRDLIRRILKQVNPDLVSEDFLDMIWDSY